MGSVVITAVGVAVAIRSWHVPPNALRPVILGVVVAPLVMVLLLAIHMIPDQLAFVLGTYAILGQTIGFIALASRPASHGRAGRRRLRTDTIQYLVASVLWFTLIYWSGSSAAIEGLLFAVTPALAGASAPHCVTPALSAFTCSHLTFWEALHYSAGNLVTAGAAGITPLDEFTRVLSTLQLVPVFVAGYALARS